MKCPKCGPGTTITKDTAGVLYCALSHNSILMDPVISRGKRPGCGNIFAESEIFETIAHSVCSCGNPRCQGPWHIFEHRMNDERKPI